MKNFAATCQNRTTRSFFFVSQLFFLILRQQEAFIIEQSTSRDTLVVQLYRIRTALKVRRGSCLGDLVDLAIAQPIKTSSSLCNI
jgi:hypothetical protein